jgi:hypothetical protein
MPPYKGTTPSARQLSGKVEGFPADFFWNVFARAKCRKSLRINWMTREARGNGATPLNDPSAPEIQMAPTTDATDPAFGDDLIFTRQTAREGVGGTWVIGLVAGHRFQALVFAGHAEDPSWELGDSRISKLWVQRLADRAVVFNFDRGLDVPARDATAGAVVDFLTAGLAEHVFG